MKKRIIASLCALTLTFGMSVATFAAVSPGGDPLHGDDGDGGGNKKTGTNAPDTGEANVIGLSFGALAILGGVAVVSRKKLAE